MSHNFVSEDIIEINGGNIPPSFDFSGPTNYDLATLDRIELIGGGVAGSRKLVTAFHLNQNHLTTLAELTGTNNEPLFPQLESVFASKNEIKFLGSSPHSPRLNAWPHRLDFLVKLDLSFNRLTSIPGRKLIRFYIRPC